MKITKRIVVRHRGVYTYVLLCAGDRHGEIAAYNFDLGRAEGGGWELVGLTEVSRLLLDPEQRSLHFNTKRDAVAHMIGAVS